MNSTVRSKVVDVQKVEAFLSSLDVTPYKIPYRGTRSVSGKIGDSWANFRDDSRKLELHAKYGDYKDDIETIVSRMVESATELIVAGIEGIAYAKEHLTEAGRNSDEE